MVSGESAGGYVSAESIIHAHPQLEVRALLLRYPMLRHYKRSDAHESELPYMGRPQIKNDVQKFVQPLWDKTQEIRQKMKDRGLIDAAKGIFADILDRRSPPRGMNGAFLTSWFGTWSGFFGRSKLDILTELEQANAKGESVGPRDPPALFIYHGTEDGNVPLEVSTTFVREYERMLKSKNLAGKVPVVFKTIKRGHGFDYEFKGNEVFDDETTFKEFMDHLLKVWLRKG
ncbi:uncharacterized protein CC84DRAFT_1170024 [Paraphaeosphaeria sporulosa]|uniref:Alpha/beta-hydrolase n=1 Tax=Paraphaeosphaeria sporulosa TaxID=1460663 RepID=A0A177BWC0_9PLEO|nr:uncharacterized protein CC84DRAFT_1170024 [Paraphaeosphaeria sporulosa]OAF98666.1 hypothetical protein CC84DRAFT_1170024 [Paraphaeosphaeria sporulosa]